MKLLALLCLAVFAHGATYNKFFIIMFENHGYNQVMSNQYWKAIINDSFLLTNYHGVTHPSQPNYVAQIAGSFAGCTDDSNCNLVETNLVDLLENKGISWKSYQENYVPGPNGDCNNATSISSEYYRKHNPFMSFTDVTSNITRCKHIVASDQLGTDVTSNALPQFGYYTPNIDNDSHNQDLTYSGLYFTNWLAKYYTPFVTTAWKDVLFMVTFDEDEGTEGNHVTTFFRGPGIAKGVQCGTGSFTHYSVTRFIEDNWSLGTLGRNDATAQNFASVLPSC